MPRQTDEPTVLDALATLVRYVLRDHRGPRAGRVTSYNPTTRTADVQPVRRRRLRGKVFDESPVVDAPVAWPRFGTMVIAGELQKGDEVLMITCERELRPWLLGGQSHDPQSQRMHAAEDSVVLPSLSSFARAITARLPGTFWIGREDGTAGVTITQAPAVGTTTVEGTGPAAVLLGSAAVSTLVKYPAFASAFATYAATVASAFATWGLTVPPTAVSNGAFIAALGPATAALATAIATAPTMGTVKTVAE